MRRREKNAEIAGLTDESVCPTKQGKLKHAPRALILALTACLLAVAGFAATPAKTPTPIKASATVRRWMKGMTLRDEVAQLVFIEFHGGSPNTRSRDYQKFVRLI